MFFRNRVRPRVSVWGTGLSETAVKFLPLELPVHGPTCRDCRRAFAHSVTHCPYCGIRQIETKIQAEPAEPATSVSTGDFKQHSQPEEAATADQASKAHEAVQHLVDKALGLMRGGNYPSAISQLKKAAALDPGDFKLQAMLADAKRQWGQILIKQNN